MDIDIGTTYGANLIGLILASVLYGVTLLQTFSYYRQYPRDSFFTKGLVFVVWFLDTAQLVLISIDMYWHLVTNYNKPEVLGKTTWSSNLQIDCNGLIGLLVICFFARRVWCLSGNIWITVIIVILAFVHLSLGIGILYYRDSALNAFTTFNHSIHSRSLHPYRYKDDRCKAA